VIISGNVEFNGKTGDVVGFGRDQHFVIVDLYNFGKHAFHASNVKYNDYADQEVDEGRFKDLDIERQWNAGQQASQDFKRKEQSAGEEEPVGDFRVVRRKDGVVSDLKQHYSSNKAFAHAQALKKKYPSMEVGVRWPTGQINWTGLTRENQRMDKFNIAQPAPGGTNKQREEFLNARDRLFRQMQSASPGEKEAIRLKIAELEGQAQSLGIKIRESDLNEFVTPQTVAQDPGLEREKDVDVIFFGKMPRDYAAETAWAALEEVLPAEYPAGSEKAQEKVKEVAYQGGAVVTTKPLSVAKKLVATFTGYGIKSRINAPGITETDELNRSGYNAIKSLSDWAEKMRVMRELQKDIALMSDPESKAAVQQRIGDLLKIGIKQGYVKEALNDKAMSVLRSLQQPAQSTPAAIDLNVPEPDSEPAMDLATVRKRIAQLDELIKMKEQIDRLFVRAQNARGGIYPGLQSDIEDEELYGVPQSDKEYQILKDKYTKDLSALQKFIAMKKAVYREGQEIVGESSALVRLKQARQALSQPSQVNELAPASNPGGGNYFQALASAWYNGAFDTGSLQKGIKSQEDVERLLQRGILGPDGVTRKYGIDYNAEFDGVVISSDDYYEHSDYNDQGQEVDSRTGKLWGPYDYMEFSDDDLSESQSVAEAQTDYQRRRQRERDIDAGRPVKPLPKNPQTDYARMRAKQKRDQDLGEQQMCPECGGPSFSDLILAEKQDACYHKVRSRYKVWPSAYASGALVQCRKKGAANWGNSSKKK